MDVVSETVERGVVERRFDLKVDDEVVPGLLWQPEGATTGRPVIFIGHGGTQDKRTPNVLSLARRFVRHLGYAAVAIDAPGHGERVTDPEAAATARRNLQQRIAAGRPAGEPQPMVMDEQAAREWVGRTSRGGRDWRATVDAVEQLDIADGRYGYWGVSMGTAIGLPFVSSDRRISAAVLGLAGLSSRPGQDDFKRAAEAMEIPVMFLFQWDDELMTRESGLALFDALGSKDKAMHIHPGGHVGTPAYERDAAEAFFSRHLGAPAA